MADDGDRRRIREIIQRLRHDYRIEVLELPGWQDRGLTWARVPTGVVDHHDASSRKSGEWGSLGVIRDGREGIPGPLSQFQIARCLDDVPRLAVVAAGRANHAGKGGPLIGIPTDAANAWVYGVESANNGVDEGYTWASHFCHDALFRVLMEVCRFAVTHVIGHREWTTRKIDPRYDMNWRRRGVTGVQHREEDDMFDENDRIMLRQVHHESTLLLPNRRGEGGSDNGTGHQDTVLGWAAHADGAAWRAEHRLPAVEAQLREVQADLATIKTMLADLVTAHTPKAPGSLPV